MILGLLLAQSHCVSDSAAPRKSWLPHALTTLQPGAPQPDGAPQGLPVQKSCGVQALEGAKADHS